LPIDLGPLGAPGCQLFVAPEDARVLPAVAGTADWQLPIPAALPLIGVTLFAQAGALAGSSIAASNAAQLVIGPR
jgi:hypothetical protein